MNPSVAPTFPQLPQRAASTRAVTTLVLGILGLVFCPLLAPVAWVIGLHELNDIAGGLAPRSGEGISRVGVVLGILGTIPLLIALAVLVLALPFVLLLVLFG